MHMTYKGTTASFPQALALKTIPEIIPKGELIATIPFWTGKELMLCARGSQYLPQQPALSGKIMCYCVWESQHTPTKGGTG